jgi:hypothetical protein
MNLRCRTALRMMSESALHQVTPPSAALNDTKFGDPAPRASLTERASESPAQSLLAGLSFWNNTFNVRLVT